jgi:DNA mismatch endonuclease (patch repair protein)
MADVHSKAVRSYNMSRIRSKDTKPEMVVRKALFAAGFRFRLHQKSLPGKPDIVLKKYRTVIMIHGCFWHGHDGCKYFVVPKTRTEWWLKKINRNQSLDETNIKALRKAGWKVTVIYECELKSNRLDRTLEKIFKTLKRNYHD